MYMLSNQGSLPYQHMLSLDCNSAYGLCHITKIHMDVSFELPLGSCMQCLAGCSNSYQCFQSGIRVNSANS